MKKVLLTSTALVAFTGAAVADSANFELSGVAEMGVFNQNAQFRLTNPNATAAGGTGTQFFTDIDVTFTMSGETDNGLTFGAVIDIDEAAGGATGNNQDDGGAYAFIEGAFGTVTMGDTDGALDWALTEAGNVGNPGSIADDETIHAGYLGSYGDGTADGQILRWDYTTGAFGVAVSLEDDNGASAPAPNGISYAVGLKYALNITGGTINFGLGYQKANQIAASVYNNFASAGAVPAGFEITIIGVSATAVLDNGLSAGITYADHDFDNAAGVNVVNVDHMGIGLGYETGPFAVHLNYGKYDVNNTPGFVNQSGYGLAAAYDLGGGAVVKFGYGSGRAAGAPREKSMSLGLALSF